jgi:hypothetical protein
MNYFNLSFEIYIQMVKHNMSNFISESLDEFLFERKVQSINVHIHLEFILL